MSLEPADVGSARELPIPRDQLVLDSSIACFTHRSGKLLIEQQTLWQKQDQEFVERFLQALDKDHHAQEQNLIKQGASKNLYFIFALACLAGLLCAFLDGIDGIASVIELLTLPPILSVLLVATSVVISIIIFVGFDVTESARSFGIELDKSTSSPFGKISEQKKQLKKINNYLEGVIIDTKSIEKLQKLAKEVEALRIINAKLDNEIINIEEYMNNAPEVMWWRKFAAVMCTVLYLNFGFFTGQAGILYLFGNITMAVAMSQPLIAVAVIGIALLSAFGYAAFYWMVQRPGVENLVSKQCFGVDLEILENIQSNEFQSELETSLTCKQKNIKRYLQYHESIEADRVALDSPSFFLKQCPKVPITQPLLILQTACQA